MAQERGRGTAGNTRSVKEESQKTIRGRAAKELLENKTLTEALRAIETGCIEAIRNSAFDEAEKRENAYQYLKAIQKLEDALHKFIKAGDNAQSYLKRELDNGRKRG